MSDVAPPPPPPPAPAPPPPPPMSKSSATPGRSALLGSIEGFNSSKLKKVTTNEKSKDTRPVPTSGGSSGGSIGVSSSKPAGGSGPSGFGDIFSGGMPKLRSTKTTTDSTTTTTTTTSAPSNPTPKPAPIKPAGAPQPTNTTTNTTPTKPSVTSISKPMVKQSTGVLRPAPVISKAPIISKVAAKPAGSPIVKPPAANNVNTQPPPPASTPKPAEPTPTPTPAPTPIPTPTTPTSKPSTKPVIDLPPSIPKPNHEEPKSTNNEDSNSGGVVSEHTILPGDGSRHVKHTPTNTTTTTTPSATNTSAPPKVTTTSNFANKPAPVGSTPANWVKPGSGPISPIGKVVQSASVQVAPPRKVTSSATPTMKPAPIISGAKKPAAVNTTTTTSTTTTTTTSSTTPTNTSNPTTPTASASPKTPAVFNIPPPISKPSHSHDNHQKEEAAPPAAKPIPTPTPVPPKEEPKPTPPAPVVEKQQETHTHTHTHHETHNNNKPTPPATISHQNSFNNKNTSPRKLDNDNELVCARCGGGIEGNHFKALDQAWHIEHFTCVECNTGIQNFVSHEGQPFCEVCYDRKFVVHKVCNVCDKPIYGTVVSAMNNTFHSECFKCSNCHSTFPDNEFYQYESKPWCATCIQNITKAKYEKCDHCHKEIDSKSDGVIKVLGSKYHNNNACFVCHGCQTVFPNLNYYEINNTPMCYNCAIKH